jgi:hypothetical protein
MNTSKHFLLAATFVILTGFCAGAAAQTRPSVYPLPPQPDSGALKVDAIKISDGTIGWDAQKQETKFGYSFLGKTFGSLPGTFSLFINTVPSTPGPGSSTVLTGGAWALPVYTANVKLGGDSYAGSLYGSVANGKMSWDKAGTSAQVYILLNVDGGTVSWDGVKGYATFVGTLSIDEKGTTTLNGELQVAPISSPIQ